MTILIYSLMTLTLFSFIRLGIYVAYFHRNRKVGYSRLFQLFLRGLRFDLSIFMVTYGILILSSQLPFPFVYTPLFRLSIYSLWFVLFLVVAGILVGDSLYFKYVDRHITFELGAIFTEGGVLLNILLKEYKAVAASVLFSTVFIALFWFAVPFYFVAQPIFPGYLNAGLKFTLTALLFAFFMHGNNLKGKPIATIDANLNANREEAALIMNGLFSSLHYFYNKKKRKSVHVMEDDLAINIVSKIVRPLTDNKNTEYPFLQRTRNREKILFPPQKPNIALIVVEGWDEAALPFILQNRESEWSDLNVMPFANRLAEQSWAFTNFFSNGQRTIDMVHTLLTSMPRLGGVPLIGYDHDFSNVNYLYLPEILKKNGYSSHLFNGSWTRSIHMDSISSLSGFDSYIAGEEINRRYLRESGLPKSEVGAWDEHLFEWVYEDLRKKTEPCFSVIFTATTHAPFSVPDKKHELFGVKNEREKFFNCMRYLDNVFYDFFNRVDNDPAFEETIFFLVSDHIIFRNNNKLSEPSLFHIPFLIHNKKYIQPCSDERVASHMDIFPTILEMIANNQLHTNFGRSLLRDDITPFAVMQQGDIIHATDGDHWMIFRDIRLKPEAYTLNRQSLEPYQGPGLENLESTAKGYYQITNSLYKRNAFYP